MQKIQSVEQLLEDVEMYAHSIRSPELLCLVLKTAWALQSDQLRIGKRKVVPGPCESNEGGSRFERLSSQYLSGGMPRRTSSSEA